MLAIVGPMTTNTNLSDFRAKMAAQNEIYQKHLRAIFQLTLTQWLSLAAKLGVEANDRHSAAKRLMIAEVNA